MSLCSLYAHCHNTIFALIAKEIEIEIDVKRKRCRWNESETAKNDSGENGIVCAYVRL